MAEKWQEFLQLTKYDPFTGEFEATAIKGGVPDRAKERLDYLRSKPNFEKVIASQSAASGGENLFPVRLQHDVKKPVGLIKAVEWKDDVQELKVNGLAVDPITKELMRMRVLTGVSIGGAYVEKRLNLKDGITDYVADPAEISLVDRPCLPQATFSMVKDASGALELCKFASDSESTSADELIAKYFPKDKRTEELTAKLAVLQKSVDDLIALQKAASECKCSADGSCSCGKCVCKACETCAKRDFSDDERNKLTESGAAMPGGGYPIKTEQDLKNAIQAIGRAKDRAATIAHIKDRAKALGLSSLIPESWEKVEKADFQNTNPEVTMKTQVPEELQKAYKAATDHIMDCHKTATAQHAERCAKSADHMNAVHGHLAAMHKALTGEDLTVPMETTKADASGDLKKEDKKDVPVSDERIAEIVAQTLNKALGIEEEKKQEPVTLEDRIAKAVGSALEPLLKKADPARSKPRFVDGSKKEEKALTSEDANKLAKSITAGSREEKEASILALFKDSARTQAEQMTN
jgi:hypothetical protein